MGWDDVIGLFFRRLCDCLCCHDIQLPMLPALLSLIGCCGTSFRGSPTQDHKYQTCLIRTILSDSIGSVGIIVLTPHIYGVFGQIIAADWASSIFLGANQVHDLVSKHKVVKPKLHFHPSATKPFLTFTEGKEFLPVSKQWNPLVAIYSVYS